MNRRSLAGRESHHSEIMYMYGKYEAAYNLLMKLANSNRQNYPEVSYAIIGTVVTGLMGIELEINLPDMAGGYGLKPKSYFPQTRRYPGCAYPWAPEKPSLWKFRNNVVTQATFSQEVSHK